MTQESNNLLFSTEITPQSPVTEKYIKRLFRDKCGDDSIVTFPGLDGAVCSILKDRAQELLIATIVWQINSTRTFADYELRQDDTYFHIFYTRK